MSVNCKQSSSQNPQCSCDNVLDCMLQSCGNVRAVINGVFLENRCPEWPGILMSFAVSAVKCKGPLLFGC